MFKPGYSVCYSATQSNTSGQTLKFSNFKIVTTDHVINNTYADAPAIELTQVLEIFTLFVVIMLAIIMVKMNQWAVQAAAQLSEGGISFTQTMQANAQGAQAATKAFGDQARKMLDIKK